MARYTPNWMQNGTYPAQLDRLLLMDAMGTQNSCLLSGTGAFAVSQHAAGASMVLDIAPGRGMVQGNFITNQGNYEIFSDAVENVTIPTAPGAGQSRIDLVIAQVRDAFVDSGGFSDFIFTTVTGTAAATGSQVAPTAPADSMTLAQVLVGPNVTSIVTANITDSRPFTRGPTVVQTVPALGAGQSYTVTHNLNTQNIQVELWDSVTLALVNTAVTILNANQISLSVTAATPNPINCIITGASPAPTPVLASDLAPKAYVDARTPNLPAPVTSGTTVQSFTDVLGLVWIAKNGVNGGAWCQARDQLFTQSYLNASQAATGTSTYNAINHDTALSDIWGCFSPTTHLWTAPIYGRYLINLAVYISFTAGANRIFPFLYVNGGNSYRGTDVSEPITTTVESAGQLTVQVQLAAGTTIGAGCWIQATSPSFVNGATINYMHISYQGSN